MKQLVILDGISGSGKSTTLTAVNIARNYRDYHFHRFTATEWVYATLYNRPFDLAEIHRIERQIRDIFVVTYVWMSCPPEIALSRKQELKDPYIEPEIAKASKLFLQYWEDICSFNMRIRLDSTQPLETNVEFLKKHLDNVEEMYADPKQNYLF